MHFLRQPVRFIARATLWLGIAIVTLFAIWLVFNRLLDEAPDSARNLILLSSVNDIPDDRNVAVGILGLSAPSGADFIKYGISVKTLKAQGAPWEQIQEMLKGSKSLQPTLTSNQLLCWLDPDLPLWKECLPFDQAPIVLEKNKELIQRFRALYSLPELSSDGSYYNGVYIDSAKLSIADMQLDLRRRNFSDAYQKWHDQLFFARRNLRGTDDYVGKSIGSIVFGITDPFLQDLLIASPILAKQHTDELLNLLRPEGAAAFNPEGLARAEYSIFANVLEHPGQSKISRFEALDWLILNLSQKNRVLNRYAGYIKEYTQAVQLPWAQIETEFARLQEKYASDIDTRDFIVDPLGSLFLNYQIGSHLKTREILRQLHTHDGRLRLDTLLVQIVSAQILDSDIEKFLASANRGLWDEFSGAPMKWDAKNRRIYFADPKDKCMITYVRVPPPVGSKLPPPPRSSPWIC